MASWAIIVGINEYPGSKGALTVLKGAVADAVEFAEWALDPAGGNVDPTNLLFWTHPAPVQPSAALTSYLTNPVPWPTGVPDFTRAPTSGEIAKAAFELALQAGQRGIDKVYIFFAGHGVQSAAQGWAIPAQNCFVAGDYIAGTTYGLVPCADLSRAIAAVGPAEGILFFDCCRSATPLNLQPPVLAVPNFAPQGWNQRCGIGHAASPGRLAFEVPILNPERGAFTRVLLCALRSYRVGNVLTADQLQSYLASAIVNVVRPQSQKPVIEVLPQDERPNLVLAQGPAMGPFPEFEVDLTGMAEGSKVLVIDTALNVVQTLEAGSVPLRFAAPIGGYSFEPPAGTPGQAVFHYGPEVTHVAIA